MKRGVQIHFCSQCLRDFKSLSNYPDRCSKCGSEAWYQMKHYRPIKEERETE
jgi:DNA-directed RNA polymerase subunit RPC12/RpoP